MLKKCNFFIILVLLFSCLISPVIFGKESTDLVIKHNQKHNQGKKKFKANKFLFEHISDAHEWHILTYKDKHISVPLPVILISKENGFITFNFSKLHHGHSTYKKNGFTYILGQEETNKGKIIEINPNGEESEKPPFDLSITKNIVALWFSVFLLIAIFLTVAKSYKKNAGRSPQGLQSLLEPVILFIRDEVAKPSIGHKYEKYTPYLLTIFFFIWFNNMLGLIPIPPGGANLTGNLAVTGVLALFTMVITNFSGNKNYWKHIFNTPGVPFWLKFPLPIMPIIELFGVFTKPFVLMIRLFANITAGHLITLGFLSLIFVFGEISPAIGYSVSPLSLLFLLFTMFLELLVAFIQAFVFTFLSALYIGMAVEEHH